MNSTTYNAQFLTIDFRLLDSKSFCSFMRSAAFPVYMQLRRYVWRGVKKRHPVDKVNELYREGHLVAAVPREVLASKLGLRNVASVSRHLAELEKRGVVRTVKTGRQNVYTLGTWEDRSLARDGSYVIEMFLLEQLHGAEPFDQPGRDDVAPGLSRSKTAQGKKAKGKTRTGRSEVTPTVTSEVTPTVTSEVTPTVTSEVTPTVTSEVTPTVTSEVAGKSHINKEANREANRSGSGADLVFLHPVGPEAIPIPFTEEAPAKPASRRSRPRRGRFAEIPPSPPFSKGGGRRLADASGGRWPSTNHDSELDYEPKYPVLVVRL